jgi:uncharacterized phiE125 gp8 family phage protein
VTLLEVTTAARVKALIDISGTSQDAVIASLIAGVSLALEKYAGCPLAEESRTELYDVEDRADDVWLRGVPVASITSVKARSSRQTDWADVTAMDSSLYSFDAGTGRLILDGTWYAGREMLQVVYTAGFAADTTAFIAAYPDLADAADKQVTHEFERRTELGAGSTGMQGTSRVETAPVALLPVVRERWDPYRRMVVG